MAVTVHPAARANWQAMRGTVFLASVAAYILSVFVDAGWVHSLSAAVSILSLVFAWPAASLTSKWLSVLFLAAGGVVAVESRLSAALIFHSFGSMLSLLSLFSMAPVLAIPVTVGGYGQTVASTLGGRRLSGGRLYLTVSTLSYLLGSMMNVAAIPMMYHSVKDVVERSVATKPQRFLIQSVVTGYAMPLTWSPVSAVVAAVVAATRIPWVEVWPVSLVLSLAGLPLSAALYFTSRFRPSHPSAPASDVDSAPALAERASAPAGFPATAPGTPPIGHTAAPVCGRGIWQIIVAVACLIVGMLALQGLTGWSMISVIAVLAVPFSFVWSALIGQRRPFLAGLAKHRRSVEKLQNTFAVFTAAGFFVVVLQHSRFLHPIDRAFVTLSGTLGPALFISVIPVLVVCLSLVGFHPIVTISLLGSALHPSVLHLSPLWLSVALLGGGVLTFIVSPFNATLNVTGSVSGVPPSQVMRWNGRFCLCYLMVVIAAAAIGELCAGIR
ncbi:MAG: hypothetical protein K6T78_06605 [Alicyclobacillus sp.]|nr:hypothetical protein [Alicyclobacillus sp.]